MAEDVEYLVVGECFVNGSYQSPSKGATVWAAPGLEGRALKLVGTPAPVEPKAKETLSLKAPIQGG